MIVKVFNTNTYEVVKSINETHYYREIMRLKLNILNLLYPTEKRIQHKINFFSS
ncbi:hypothetical protein 162285156 [Organic Lake phycodnavirus 1]|jgi:hypothetical protein|nr:hypothetical protein 162290231 [Organic Lake phycodnavirus 1]ADX06092.1 hypothetical protein 162285156 [Organic Lake phycodnavirus 1]